MEQSIKEIQEISNRYGLELDVEICGDKLRMLEKGYQTNFNGTQENRKEFIVFLIDVGVCKCLKLSNTDKIYSEKMFTSQEVPVWIKEQIEFICYSNDGKIGAKYFKFFDFNQEIIERYDVMRSLEEVISPQVMEEYEFKNIFLKKEATNFLSSEIRKIIEKIVHEINQRMNYNEMSKEIYGVLDKSYGLSKSENSR